LQRALRFDTRHRVEGELHIGERFDDDAPIACQQFFR
jgi:hypothetical protein